MSYPLVSLTNRFPSFSVGKMAKGKRKTSSAEKELQETKKPSKTTEKENMLLANMMQHLVRDTEIVSFMKSSTDLDFMERTKTWRAAWKELIDKGFIVPCGPGCAVYAGDYKLTETGKEHASTDEYKEYIKDKNFQPTTNEEHQTRIKKKLINQHGVRMFDLLLEHGSLTRKELSGIVGVNDRSHQFSYALQQLKQKGWVELDSSAGGKGKQLRLADKSFLSGQRPESEQAGPEDIAKLISNAAKAKLAKKEGSKKKAKKVKPPKSEEKANLKEEPQGEEKQAPEAARSEEVDAGKITGTLVE